MSLVPVDERHSEMKTPPTILSTHSPVCLHRPGNPVPSRDRWTIRYSPSRGPLLSPLDVSGTCFFLALILLPISDRGGHAEWRFSRYLTTVQSQVSSQAHHSLINQTPYASHFRMQEEPFPVLSRAFSLSPLYKTARGDRARTETTLILVGDENDVSGVASSVSFLPDWITVGLAPSSWMTTFYACYA